MRSSTSFSGPLSTRNTVLPFSSRSRPRLLNTCGSPCRLSAVNTRVDALLHVGGLRRGLLEAVEYLRQHVPEDLGGGLADVDGAIAGAAVVAAEVDAAREAGAFRRRRSSSLCLRWRTRSSAMRAGRVLTLGLALLAGEHLLRAEQLDGLAIDRLVEGDGPEDVLALLLAARAQVGRERAGTPCRRRRAGAGTSGRHPITSRPWIARPALKVLVSNSVCDGWGCQKEVRISE